MEAILRSVLLRQEQMQMQWDAEFEQQKQLFHINTSTLIDMLPIQPRKKRLKLGDRVSVPSHDKENLLGFQGFVPNEASLRSLKTKAPSRGLAKRDLNMRFCDNDVKERGLVVSSKPAEIQPSLRNCSDVERIQQSASTVHAVNSSIVGSIGGVVKDEVDEGEAHVSPPTDDSLREGITKRLRGEEEEVVVAQNRNEQTVVPQNVHEEFRDQTNRTSLIDLAEKEMKPKRTRKIGKAKECALEVEAHELSCRDEHLARGEKPEIVCKIQLESKVESCRDTQVIEPETESKVVDPEIISKGPSRRGRTKGATTVTQAAVVPENVSKKPARRGRPKQASVSQFAPRVTRSRARMGESVVEPQLERSKVVETVIESKICQKIPGAQVVSHKAAEQDVELEPLYEAEVKGRPSNLIVDKQIEEYSKPTVCAPAKETVLDELRSTKSSHGQKSVNRAAANASDNINVSFDSVRRGSPHFDSEVAATSLLRSGELNVRIDSRVAGTSANVNISSVEHVKDGQHESLPQPHLDTIENCLRYRDVNLAPAEHSASICKQTGLGDDSAPSAAFVAASVKEKPERDARSVVASEWDTLSEKDLTPGDSPIQVQVTEEETQVCISEAPCPPGARLSACEEASQHLIKIPRLIPDVTSISEFSKEVFPNIKEAFTTLLSGVTEGATLPSNQWGDPESLILVRSPRSSLQSRRISSAAVSLALPEAGNDVSASEVYELPAAVVTRKSGVTEVLVSDRDGSGKHLVGVLNTLDYEKFGLESGNRNGEDSIEVNEEKSEQMAMEFTQDGVMNSTSVFSHFMEPNNSRNSKDEAFRMDIDREQVNSDVVSPVKYSEARAMEEAIRCSLEEEFHPDVTLTLNRWQFRKRLSPRSKARARRWRSDVATNGVNCGRRQSPDAPAASPIRIASSRERSPETFVEAKSPDVSVQGVESSVSLEAGKAVDQETIKSQQEQSPQSEGTVRRSMSSLCNDTFCQDLNDVEIKDNTTEREIMETADMRNGTSTPLPLLQSIYALSKACQNDMVGAREFLEEREKQQVHNLIESAKKIMEQLSSKAVGAHPTTPASNDPTLNNSMIHAHTNLYPDQLRLFITPRSSPPAPPIVLPPPGTCVSPAAPEIGGDIESTSPQLNRHLIRESTDLAVSRSPHCKSDSSEPAVRADKVTSHSSSGTPYVNELITISNTGKFYILGEGDNAVKCSSAVEPGYESFTVVDSSQVNIGADVLPNRVLLGRSTNGTAVPIPASQYDGPLGSETAAESEKLPELKSRFYALSEDYVETASALKDVPNFLRSRQESVISHTTDPSSPILNLRFSPGQTSKQHMKTPPSAKDGHLDAGENENPAVLLEEETRIPCSPIFIGNERERVDRRGDNNSEPAEEPVDYSQCITNAGPASMLDHNAPQCSSSLISDLPSVPPSNSNLPRSNLVSSLRSFIPLVQQQQSSAPYPNGKRDVKVKALEAAEAAKRLAEQKEFERQERKKVTEIARREKLERAAVEKLAKKDKAAQEKLRQQEARAAKENGEACKKKTVATGSTKFVMTDSTNGQGTSNQSVLLKVKKTHELKLKMDLEKQERLLEEQRRKEEDWRKKEAENAARKRKHEAAEKKERDDKRRRQEDAMKAHREFEEWQRLELEKKTQKQRAMEELEKERKNIEEELKRHRRQDKEREVEQRRRKEEERELAWLEEKEATRKRKEESARQVKLLENEGRQQVGKIRRPSNDPSLPSAGPYHSFMASLHMAMGIGEGIGAHLSGVNSVGDPQRVSSQSLVGHPLRVLHHSAEGAGAIRNSQAAMRVPRTTPESVSGVSNGILGSGKPLFRTPPEALGNALASIAVSGGGGSSSKALIERINIIQSGSKAGASSAGGSKPCQPGQVVFAGPPGGVIVEKGIQSYEVSPFRDSEDDDSEEEEKRSQKPIPSWAREENMLPQLLRQLEQDPDDIFVGASSCSLDKVFQVKGSKRRPDFRRRGSSGDWAKDCLTWQEQIQYKVSMGFVH